MVVGDLLGGAGLQEKGVLDLPGSQIKCTVRISLPISMFITWGKMEEA